MVLQDIKQLFAYNTWANNKIFEAVTLIPAEQYLQDMKSGHGGIHGTLTHIVAGQKMWLSRWVGKPDSKLLHGEDIASLAELQTLWHTVDAHLNALLEKMTDSHLHETQTVTSIKGEVFTHTFGQMMQHLVNHSSFHRGQVATMIRQLGIKPPATDLIAYYRLKI
ncbi:MAG: DinB family protein [Ignavibacteriae bacterium]|nr:DinB family protein [Ignavibacteriota bacterium]